MTWELISAGEGGVDVGWGLESGVGVDEWVGVGVVKVGW